MASFMDQIDDLESDCILNAYDYDVTEYDRAHGIKDDDNAAEIEAGLANVCEMMEAGLCPF